MLSELKRESELNGDRFCFIEILRKVVLRGADLLDLLPSSLAFCGLVVLAVSVLRFQKRLEQKRAEESTLRT